MSTHLKALEGKSLTSKDRHLSHGFYRVSDREAQLLAKAVGRPLPKQGYQLRVGLPSGREMWLQRTEHSVGSDAPKRGWVWAIWD